MENKKHVKLAGVKFALLNCRGKEVACGVTNREGELIFDRLPFGRYFIKELETPCEFEKGENLIEVCIGRENPHRAVEILNERKKGSIKIFKLGVDEDDGAI